MPKKPTPPEQSDQSTTNKCAFPYFVNGTFVTNADGTVRHDGALTPAELEALKQDLREASEYLQKVYPKARPTS